MYELDLRDSKLPEARTHYGIEIDGDFLAYCYIRKNACSAFKKLFRDESQHAELRNGQGALQFMSEHHSVGNKETIQRATFRICVLRDAAERAASLFRNKFVAQSGHADVFRSYQELVGEDPATASFRDFVSKYLSFPLKKLDPHAFSQRSHLLPIHYNAVILIQDLYSSMISILGEELAASYFAKKSNSSSERLFDDRSVEAPANELRRRYLKAKELPSVKALCDASSMARIRSAYAVDYEMLALCKTRALNRCNAVSCQ